MSEGQIFCQVADDTILILLVLPAVAAAITVVVLVLAIVMPVVDEVVIIHCQGVVCHRHCAGVGCHCHNMLVLVGTSLLSWWWVGPSCPSGWQWHHHC